MIKEELLKPRYKVIADYPNSEWKVGKILVRVKDATNDIFHVHEYAIVGDISLNEIKKYPHIFKPLEWWEEREEKDIEFVTWKSCNSGITYVAKVLERKGDDFKWEGGWGTFTKDQDFPATKEEYENAASLLIQ